MILSIVIYNIILTSSLPFFPILKFLTRKRGKLTILSRFKTDFEEGKNKVLIHASSIGEVRSIKPLIRSFDNVALTVSTDYGLDIARKLYPNTASRILPIDIYPIALRFLKLSKPKAILLYETEIWPSLIAAAKKLDIPVFVVSGKISDRSFKRYLFFKRFLKPVVSDVSFLARSKGDAERAVQVGFQSVKVMGDLKFDVSIPKFVPLRLHGNRMVILWASLHGNECELALNVHKKLKKRYPNLLSIVAPRYVKDFMTIEGLEYEFRSKTKDVSSKTDVYIVDTIGELSSLYRFCDIAVIGGSFIKGIGGHNPLEAVIFKKPVIMGEFVPDFKDIIDKLANVTISTKEGLTKNLDRILSNEGYRITLGKKLYNNYIRNTGVSERIREEVLGAVERHKN